MLLILLTLANAVMNLQQEGKAAAFVAALSRAGATPPVAHRHQLRHAGPGLAQEQAYRVPRCRGSEIPVGLQRG